MTELVVIDNTDVTVVAGSEDVVVVGTVEQGPQGVQGIQGAPGDPGPQGTDGFSVRSGAGGPSDLDGNDGDFYINTDTWLIHGPKVGGAWPFGVSLVGPQGAQGNEGPQGDEGPAGHVMPSGRLTLSSGVPVMAASVVGATTVYWTPYKGDRIPVWDGTQFLSRQFAETSQALSDTTKSPAATVANSNYDMFAWHDGPTDEGTNLVTRGPAWSSATARGTGAGTTELEMHNGVLVNKFAITNGPSARSGTYVGSIRTNASNQVDWRLATLGAGGVDGIALGVWNMYNRARVAGSCRDSTNYTYSSATVRQSHAGTGDMRASFLSGIAEEAIHAAFITTVTLLNVAGSYNILGIGLDSTTAFSSPTQMIYNNAALTGAGSASVNYAALPAIGWHFVASLEQGNGTNANTINAGQNQTLYVFLTM